MSGRIAKWSVKLSAYDLVYEPRAAINSQALADFVTDFSSDIQQEANWKVQQLDQDKGKWILFTNGASSQGVGLGIILKSSQGGIIPQAIKCDFQATNNEAEYEALILGLQLSKDLEVKIIHVFMDSLLLANHFNGSYAVRSEKLTEYMHIVKNLAEKSDSFIIEQVPREENAEADALANLGSTFRIPTKIKIPIIHILNPTTYMPSLDEKEIIREVAKQDPQVNEVAATENVVGQDPQINQ
ncbi:uncharacterized protein LOC143541049 [Bidens hawaiensis]|uniref:uncharacterized protein LOC143541049 n=1 Tax=Bidens hawaiensis TaxID=980011 RepID=UPI0040494236